jgi:hypothetical protein
MKAGKFFPIPETPGDVEALRAQAAPLDGTTLPVWLDERDAVTIDISAARRPTWVRATLKCCFQKLNNLS